MNIWVNSDGTRNRDFRPLIQNEWFAKNLSIYNPNDPNVHYGLYDTAQPTCGPFVSVWDSYPGRKPDATVDTYGRLKLTPITYNTYAPLRDNVRPTI